MLIENFDRNQIAELPHECLNALFEQLTSTLYFGAQQDSHSTTRELGFQLVQSPRRISDQLRERRADACPCLCSLETDAVTDLDRVQLVAFSREELAAVADFGLHNRIVIAGKRHFGAIRLEQVLVSMESR